MLELKDISKKLDTFTLRKTSFAVEKGEYFILLGESGVGKTVILEIIAGLIKPDTGSVLKNQTDLGNLSLKNRGIGLV
ncbi:MAG: ATP-binding cassette domain-containing protein, partial [Spirochaetes bacterium]|nr:ATP-binding cassette domain-containing protein [Spirochaetota bacterium]